MPDDLAILPPAGGIAVPGFVLPAVIADQGDKAAERFFTFFTDTIPNANTRGAYHRETPKTAKLYDRTSDRITIDEVERIVIWPGVWRSINESQH